MAGDNCFTIVQQKLLSVSHVALCTTMDLIGVLAANGTVSLYRTFSWERSMTKSDILGGGASAFTFSHNGKIISMGSEDGSIVLLDLESSNHLTACTINSLSSAAVTSIVWMMCYGSLGCPESSEFKETWAHGGVNLAARAGMREYYEADGPEQDEAKESFTLAGLLSCVSDTVMLALQASEGVLTAYACGIYPLYTVCLTDMFPVVPEGPANSHGEFSLCLHVGRSKSIPTVRKIFLSSADGTSGGDGALHVGLSLCMMKQPHFLCSFKAAEHKCRLLLQMQKDVGRLEKLLSDCGRKWKDAARAIPAKMSLVKSTLQGYEMNYSPVQFFYSVALFGQWHPAAQTTFGTHWNEQGLQRLRSSINTASSDVLRLLELNIRPVLVNFLLRCRELVGLMSSEHKTTTNTPQQRLLELQNVIHNGELMMFKLDEAVCEATMASRALKLFLQFVKNNSLLATAEANKTDPTQLPVDTNPRAAYLPLFDPRIPRAPETVGGAAQAEAVCGTHLYAYFQDAPIPKDVVQYRSQCNGFYSCSPPPQLKHDGIVKEILKASGNTSLTGDASPSESTCCTDEFLSISLLSQFKVVKGFFQHVFLHGSSAPTPNDGENHDRRDTTINIMAGDPTERSIYIEDVVNVSDVLVNIRQEKEMEQIDNPYMIENGVFIAVLHGSGRSSTDDSLCTCAVDGASDCPPCDLLLLWRVDNSDGVRWLATSIAPSRLPVGFCWHNISTLKVYVSTPPSRSSAEMRHALIACIQSATDPRSVCVAKMNLIDVEYDDITAFFGDDSGSKTLQLMDIMSAIGEVGTLDIRTRVLHVNGRVQDTLCATARGVVGVLAASELCVAGTRQSGSSKWDAVTVLDMEDDEDDDEDGEESEGDGEEGDNNSADEDDDAGGDIDMTI